MILKDDDGAVLKEDTVCAPHKLVSGSLKPGHSTTIQLWHKVGEPYIDCNCYFWCTETGHLPTASDSVIISNSLFNDIVGLVSF